MAEATAAIASMPRINEPAPDFSAKTSHRQRSPVDYRRKWLILFSHPADANRIATPEGWQPGDKVIVPPPQTAPATQARAGEG